MTDAANPGFTEPDDAPPFDDDISSGPTICGRLMTASLTPPTMTECGLPPEHEGECVPYTSLKAKRKVSYNQDVVLCPICTKRIRLNNNGRLRIHVAGKVGSNKCVGSNSEPVGVVGILAGTVLTDEDVKALADEAEIGYDPNELIPRSNIFSDQ
jgi:hypothetical protein